MTAQPKTTDVKLPKPDQESSDEINSDSSDSAELPKPESVESELPLAPSPVGSPKLTLQELIKKYYLKLATANIIGNLKKFKECPDQ